ncbi:MAG: glycosyltransferase family 39 protein [Chloroflexi bacterium]|nr:glycosyltransferase family 39 protein [Chloroflexota bacterium]
MLPPKSSLILILLLALLLAVSLLNGHLVPAGDNSTYMVLGQALATGQGYRMVSDPRAPQMALYPPGYPLLLAGVMLLTDTASQLLAAIWPAKLLTIAFYLGTIALCYGLFRRRDASLAALATLLVAVNPELLYFSNDIGTEIPYIFLSLLCIWLFTWYWQKQRTARLCLVALALGLTFYVRSIALVLVVAFAGYLVLQRQFKHALVVLLISGAMAIPWFFYTASLPTTGTSVGLGRGYFALYFSNDPYGTMPASPADWAARVTQNLGIYAFDIWPVVLFPHALRLAQMLGSLRRVALLTIPALVLIGFVLEIKRSRRASQASSSALRGRCAEEEHGSEWYVALFFASCAGYLWAQTRLIVPIIPFAIYYLLRAVRSLLEAGLRGKRWMTRPVLVLVTAVLALSALVANVRSIEQNLRTGLGKPVSTYYAADVEWSNYLQAMDWIAANDAPSAVVMCRKADLMYIHTGFQALEYPYSIDGAELKQVVYNNKVAYLIEDQFTWSRTTEQYLRPALQSWQAEDPGALVLAWETSIPRTRVWRVTKKP